ncbi:MAG: Gfo/Idh/MocA family oxidoreductase [Clostridia bacterium]|nr:Gfo/Idh/MocA family oxidoreductase [Clostridia bacterium]
MQKIIAVIGCGRIASGAHFPALSKMEDVTIKYACDLIPEKAQKLADQYGAQQVITDYHIALNDPEVQTVFVLTPNYAHYVVTMDALRAGKNVFCEKPITVNYKLSKEMADEANKQGKLLNIGVCNRFHESVCRIAKMNAEGKLGNIYHVYCSFRAHRSIPGLGGSFTNKKESGGGVLIDWGIHYLDLILFILGGVQLKTVSADTYSEMAKDMKAYKCKSMWAEDTRNVENGVNDVEDFVTGYIRTDKASISFNGAWAQNIGKADTYIDFLGDKGGVRLDYCGHFTFYGSDLSEDRPDYEIPNMYYAEDSDFLDACETGRKNKSHIDHILESAKLLDAIYQSADEHKEIQF